MTDRKQAYSYTQRKEDKSEKETREVMTGHKLTYCMCRKMTTELWTESLESSQEERLEMRQARTNSLPPSGFYHNTLEQPKSGFTPGTRKLFHDEGPPRPFCQEITSEEILARPTTHISPYTLTHSAS